jgi:hypothetical protein
LKKFGEWKEEALVMRRNVLIALMVAILIGITCPMVEATVAPEVSFFVVDNPDNSLDSITISSVILDIQNYSYPCWSLEYSTDNSHWNPAPSGSQQTISTSLNGGSQIIYFRVFGGGSTYVTDANVIFGGPDPAPLFHSATMAWNLVAGNFDISVSTAQGKDWVSSLPLTLPIPASFLLLGSGLLGLDLLGWRRKRG